MAKRRKKPAPHTSAGRNLVTAAVIVLLLVVGVLAFVQYKNQQARQQAAAPVPAATMGGDGALLDADRLVFGGMPRARGEAAPTFTVLKNTAYVTGYSEARKNPLWTGYRVFNNPRPYSLPRPTGGFIMDTRTNVVVKDRDFARSGYDRGHMAPNSAIARCYGPAAQLETFLLTNICPQTPALNEKVWERLEAAEKTYVERLGEVWVVAGPIFADMNGGKTQRLASGIAVPTAFYKILVDEEGNVAATQAGQGRPRLFAVIMPQNVKGTELPQQFVTSVREIENQTHLDFLWKMEDGAEEELETKVWPMWSRAGRN